MSTIYNCIISLCCLGPIGSNAGPDTLLLYYRAILIMFYRPYGTEVPAGLHPAHHQKWQHRMRREADTAASRTNDILDTMAQENLLEFALPLT